MSDNILKQLYGATKEVSKDLGSVETTLGKLLKLEKDQEKFAKKKHSEEQKAKKKEAREDKKKKADFQGFKGVMKMKKSEKDEEKKGLFEMLTSGLGGFIGKIGGAISGLATTLITSLGGLGLGGIITGAMGVIGPALLAALGAFGLKILTSKKVTEAVTENVTNPMVAEAGQAFGEQFGVNRDTYRAQLTERFQAGKESEQAEILADKYAGKEDFFGNVQADGTMTPEELDQLKKNNEELDELIQIIRKKNSIESKLDKIETYLADPSTVPWYQRLGMNDADVIERLKKDKNNEKAHLKTLRATLESDKFNRIAGANEMDMATYLEESGGYLTRQLGGHINVPGSGEGDKVPMLLPQGSFVLNKMASMQFQTGGMVPTLLEPGEKVFMPGDWDSSIEQLNGMIPRFQTGGFVGTSRSKMVDTGEVDYKGRKVLLSPAAAEAWNRMMEAGMPYNPNDITNVFRDQAEYKRLLAAGHGAAANSRHNHGLAADIHGAMNSWIRQNGAKYGWAAHDYKGTHGGHFEYVGKGSTPTPSGQLEAAEESLGVAAQQGTGQLQQAAGDLMSGLGEGFQNLMSGLSGFGEGFMEGFNETVNKDHPVYGMLSGAIGSIGDMLGGLGNMMGGGDSNPLSNLLGGGPETAAGGGDGVTAKSTPISGSVAEKAKMMYNYLLSKGVSPTHAKGIVANINAESTFRPGVMGDNGTSGGLFQMHKGRYNAMVKAVPDWKTNWKGQIDHALATDRAPDYLKMQFKTPKAAADWFMNNYERPAQRVRAQRSVDQAAFIKQLGLQQGGQVTPGHISRSPSALQKRMAEAQAKRNANITIRVEPVVVYEDAPEPTISDPGGVARNLAPELPDGPGSDMASDYFFNLSLGAQ